PQTELGEVARPLGRERLPDAKRQPFALVDPTEDRRRPEPAVLVVDGCHATAVRGPDPLTGGRHPLVLGHGDEALPEAPGGLLAQDTRRFALRVAFDDAALDLEVAAGNCERGRVEPERVVVLRPESSGGAAGRLVEVLAG